MKIKVDAEKLIAKYLLGDLTDPEKEQLEYACKELGDFLSTYHQ